MARPYFRDAPLIRARSPQSEAIRITSNISLLDTTHIFYWRSQADDRPLAVIAESRR